MNTDFHKGYNGRRRKVLRFYKLIFKQFRSDETFDTLYATGYRIAELCRDIPAGDPIHRTVCNAMGLISEKAFEDYNEELLAEYWASVL